MRYRKFKLANGIRVIAIKKRQRPFVTFKVFVKAGSRHDENLPGLAHLVEHTIFRNYNSKSSSDIYDKIESLGGKIDGNTTKEYTNYSLVILKENFPDGLKILSEILTNPGFEADNIEHEKGIIFEEILNSYSKTMTLWDVFAQTIWKESPLRHPIAGYKDSIREITLKDVLEFYSRYYTGNNIVLVVIGDIDDIGIEKIMGTMFSGIKVGEKNGRKKTFSPHTLNRTKKIHIDKNSLQTQLLVGYPGVGIKAPDINAFKLINKILGNGLSSRLYKKMKVDLHLVYSISSVLAIYEDTGYFAVWTNFNYEKSGSILNTLFKEFDSLKKEKISREELDRAKVRYKRDLLINYDTDYSLADFLGTSLLLTGKIKTFDDIIREINSVGVNQLFDLANTYFREENRFILSLGKN